MSVNIKWNLQVGVQSGPTLTIPAQTTTVDGYDVINVKIAHDQNPVRVEVTQSSMSELLFLGITSDTYDGQISYVYCNYVDPANANYHEGDAPIILDCPHFYFDNSMIGLLVTQNPFCLKFTNNTPKDIQVGIMLGRKATGP